MKETVIRLVSHRLMLGNLTKMDQPPALFLNKILVFFRLELQFFTGSIGPTDLHFL